jgi:dipeptidyl aminopeptidase/acylaminoacyl peptidase
MCARPSAVVRAVVTRNVDSVDGMSTVFTDLDAYNAEPRLAQLVVSPDDSRIVCVVQTLAPDRTSFHAALWDVDPAGVRPARRLTRSAAGETAPAFTPEGDVLFVSKRPDVEAKKSDAPVDEVAALWSLPAAGGDARKIAGAPGGLSTVLVAASAGTVVVTGLVLPGSADTDGERRKARHDAGVSALLHETTPVRHWDHDLGPDEVRLFVAEDSDVTDDSGGSALVLRDLTPMPGRALDEPSLAISSDGSFVVSAWRARGPLGRESRSVELLDLASGQRRTLIGNEGHFYDQVAISPDDRVVVCTDELEADYDIGPRHTLLLVDVATGVSRDLLPDFPMWPSSPVFAADGAAVFFVADENGRAPVFRVDVATGDVVRLTAEGAYSQLHATQDGRHVFALRAGIDEPMVAVRLDIDVRDQEPTRLPGPCRPLTVPGRVEEVEATAADGASVRGWLVLPDGASAARPAPLALWVHGGPLMSWNAWSWRWNPWLLAARGWAVLLPDPALSQGYGDAFIQRGWGTWGAVPFADLMAVTDVTVARPDIDETRTAAMGGSYGGFMANWIAGHTERFKAIVTHASLWVLDAFTGTTDHPWGWEVEWGHPAERPERYLANSPHHSAARIRTPMLVIHGDKDYRVPLDQGVRLFADLVRAGVDAKFLYFPDEGHWVLRPGNAKVWYQTVFAFLDHHVLDEPWVRPELV